MKSFAHLLLCLFLLSACRSNSGNKIQKFSFPQHLSVISPSDSVSFNEDWFENKHKVAVYIKQAGRYSTLSLNWNDYIEEFPEIAFLFYISEQDSLKLVHHLSEVSFKHPIIYDPEEIFHKENDLQKPLTFISFLLKDDIVVEMSNPSLPNFRERLEDLTNN